jgi:hypothetical protein
MESLKILPDASTPAYKALGNAINVHVMQVIAKALIGNGQNNVRPKAIQHYPRNACAQVAVAP